MRGGLVDLRVGSIELLVESTVSERPRTCERRAGLCFAALAAIEGARFGHINLTGGDWRRLAAFYRDVFGCELVPPERDYRSADLDAGTNLRDAHLTGAHLRLPGHGDAGPTIEIYQYDEMVEGRTPPLVNRPGWGHVAFQVPDVEAALQAFVQHGGRRFGEIVTLRVSDGRRVTWCYACDPGDNLIELQAWSDAEPEA